MRRIGIITAAFIAIAFLASFIFPIRNTESWCDPISGSLKWQTHWPFDISTSPRIDVSPLELRLHAIGYQWVPPWKGLHLTHRTVWGLAVEYDCSDAPPIYQIRCVLDAYAKAASADDLRKFATCMQSGTEQEQKAAVDSAGEKGLAAIESGG